MSVTHKAVVDGAERVLTCWGDGCLICQVKELMDQLCTYGPDLHRVMIAMAEAEHEATHA